MNEKQCTKCGVVKLLSEFYPLPTGKLGRRPRCKTCELEGASEKTKEWYKNNKDKAATTRRQYAKENPEKVKSAHTRWVSRNKDRVLAIKAKYRNANKERLALAQKMRFAEQPDKRKATVKKWAEKNLSYVREKVHTRRARKICATSSWDEEFDRLVLNEATALAIIREEMTGVKWHVDHIEPLQGKDVCGLHNGFNVAVVPAVYNHKKSNRRNYASWIEFT